MRIVRFYLESWQKGSTPSPSASLLLLSPRLRRRQRIPKMEELEEYEQCTIDSSSNDGGGDKDRIETAAAAVAATGAFANERRRSKRKKQRNYKFYWKSRYPPTVEKLSVLCSDVLAKHVMGLRAFLLYLHNKLLR
jgi:hypothetical protein